MHTLSETGTRMQFLSVRKFNEYKIAHQMVFFISLSNTLCAYRNKKNLIFTNTHTQIRTRKRFIHLAQTLNFIVYVNYCTTDTVTIPYNNNYVTASFIHILYCRIKNVSDRLKLFSLSIFYFLYSLPCS